MRLREWIIKWWYGSKDEPCIASSQRAAVNENDYLDPFNPFPSPITIKINDIFDLHTIAPRDVMRVVEEYLLEARRLGFRSVRIIHGKGIGVQREMVHNILARTPFVKDFADAPPQAGGMGATIAHLSSESDQEPQ